MTNDEDRMTNQETTANSNAASSRRSGQTFDLEERTSCFGEACIRFAKTIRPTDVTRPLISQLVRAATSVGANYMEANDAESRRDFRHIINRCRKEAKECKHWFRMIVAAVPELRTEAASLWQEAKELNLIFSAIRRRTKE